MVTIRESRRREKKKASNYVKNLRCGRSASKKREKETEIARVQYVRLAMLSEIR